MSSESSVNTSTASRIRQFGLYRTIDARTEEFLRLSRKRQIRQGCACAAISTAITVTVVIVILLIYEYAIAVESSLVQIRRRGNRRTSDVNVTNDMPVADRLDRSYFGFDQDYYERMPLLVNAMQENSYVDPTIEITIDQPKPHKVRHSTVINNISFMPSQLRRTSPRPFIFEYKSPTPIPFSKTYGSKSWIESYRNAQRLQNIQQVIKYLEKTINAKIGDMYTAPSNKQISFTGVYVEPEIREKSEPSVDLVIENSRNIIKSNHKSDPLFKYKPDNPGEVNLLADNFFRFSPRFTSKKEYTNIPIFRPIPNKKRKCFGHSCESDEHKIHLESQSSSSETYLSDSPNLGKAKLFSVLLNLYPMKNDNDILVKKPITAKPSQLPKIYITTSKPTIHFKKKNGRTTKRRPIPIKRPPRIYNENKPFPHNIQQKIESQEKQNSSYSGSNMIVQINLYSPDKKNDLSTQSQNVVDSLSTTTLKSDYISTENQQFIPTESNYFIPVSPYTTETLINLSSTQVEDFHVGSSGIIPIEARTTPPTITPLSTVTTTLPFYDVTLSSTEGAWYTRPPDILKFSHADAKIPMTDNDHWNYRESEYQENVYADINRRNFRDRFDIEDVELQTIVTKLRNNLESTTASPRPETTTMKEEETTVTTTTTQINGHYRSVNRKIVNSWLDPNSETNRKRRLNLLAKGFRRSNFSVSYTEIDRNKKHIQLKNSSNSH